MVKLIRKSGQISTIVVLNIGGSHNSFEELTLQNNFNWSVHVFSLDAELFDESSVVLLSLGFIIDAEIVVVVDSFHDLADVVIT